MRRQTYTPVLRDVVDSMPATRRQIMERIGWTTIGQDRALSRYLKRLREEGRIRMTREPDKRGGTITWHRIGCPAHIPAPHRMQADVCRCRDASCPDRATCERWIKRHTGRSEQATFRVVAA